MHNKWKWLIHFPSFHCDQTTLSMLNIERTWHSGIASYWDLGMNPSTSWQQEDTITCSLLSSSSKKPHGWCNQDHHVHGWWSLGLPVSQPQRSSRLCALSTLVLKGQVTSVWSTHWTLTWIHLCSQSQTPYSPESCVPSPSIMVHKQRSNANHHSSTYSLVEKPSTDPASWLLCHHKQAVFHIPDALSPCLWVFCTHIFQGWMSPVLICSCFAFFLCFSTCILSQDSLKIFVLGLCSYTGFCLSTTDMSVGWIGKNPGKALEWLTSTWWIDDCSTAQLVRKGLKRRTQQGHPHKEYGQCSWILDLKCPILVFFLFSMIFCHLPPILWCVSHDYIGRQGAFYFLYEFRLWPVLLLEQFTLI
jgi:hypothetical protein